MKTATAQPIAQLPFPCPPGLLGAALMFWGWQSHWLLLGLPLALLVETARWLPWRLPVSDRQFMRIADSTAVLMLIAGAVFLAVNLTDGLFYLVRWLPLIIVFPLCAQLLSERQRTPLKAVVATLRKRPAGGPEPLFIDLRLPYFYITLIASSISVSITHTFYLVSGLFIAWSLWKVRSRRYPAALWFGFTGMALVIGFILHIGLYQLQGVAQDMITRWFENDWANRDLNSNTTAIGQIGRLKLSEEIVMRIRSSSPVVEGGEVLLEQVEYNRYVGGTWFADNQDVGPLRKDPAENTWFISNDQPALNNRLAVATYLTRGEGVLALPRGSYAVASNTDARFNRTAFGAIRVEDAPRLFNFTVYYDRAQRETRRPTPHDLEVPFGYRRLMNGIINELGLDTMSPDQAVLALKQFFERNFTYSLIQSESDLKQNPLHYFLRQGRSGHCEYFATAGVLLLRAAHIPARYVTGFAMSEYDAEDNEYIVRKRHAHAWTKAYLNGKWVELDYTPSTWAAMEAEAAPWWQSGYDFMSNLVFLLNQWWLKRPGNIRDYLLIMLGLATTIYLFSKVRAANPWLKFTRRAKPKSHHSDYPGKDSPFYKIIHYLESTIAPRAPGEALKPWLQRIGHACVLDLTALEELLEQHYSYRFNTRSHDPIDIVKFDKQVDKWLAARKETRLS